jgi:hypothetical protein
MRRLSAPRARESPPHSKETLGFLLSSPSSDTGNVVEVMRRERWRGPDGGPSAIGRQGTVESAPTCRDCATAPRKYISNFSFPTLFSASWYTKAVRDVDHVERRGADLHRGVRRHGRADAAGVIVERQRRCADQTGCRESNGRHGRRHSPCALTPSDRSKQNETTTDCRSHRATDDDCTCPRCPFEWRRYFGLPFGKGRDGRRAKTGDSFAVCARAN